MSILSFFGRPRCAPRPARARPDCEGLEDRRLLSAAAISGYVFNDVNNDGLFQPGEPPIAGSNIELHDAQGATVASAVTDANGLYQFTADQTVSQAPATRTVVASFDPAKTGWTKTAQVAQFDPSLGTLQSVEVVNTPTLNTQFQFENIDSEPGTVSAAVKGDVTVSVPGASALAAQVTSSDSFDAGAYDGAIDFAGASGHDSGLKTQSGSQSVTITDPGQLQAFEGTGSVTVSAHARSTSTTSGPGNLVSLVNTTAGAQVQVIYHYVPSNALRPGTYTVVQTSTPAGYVGGLKSSGGTVIPNSAGTNSITVNLQNGSSTDNDFAELKPATLSGHVYVDLNNDGVRHANDPPVPGTTVTLTGTDNLSDVVRVVLQTDTSGFYHFDNLRPGNYTITKTPPPNYLDGKNTLGTLNGVSSGTVGNNQFFVTVGQGDVGLDYDFGELLPPAPPQVVTPPVVPPPDAPPDAPPPDAPPPPPLSKVLFLSSTFWRW
jgi:hypothetical protein